MARYEEKNKREAYEVYVTDVLRTISESTAKFSGGPYVKQRYTDLIKPKPKQEQTGKEIADSIIHKIARK